MKKLIDRLHVPPYLFLSREDDDDVKDIGKHDFRSALFHPLLSLNANLCIEPQDIKNLVFHVIVIKKLEERSISATHDKRRWILCIPAKLSLTENEKW